MKKSLFRSAVAAAALASLGAAQATVITFDEPIVASPAPFLPLVTHLDFLSTQGYTLGGYNTKTSAQTNDLVGALINDPSPLGIACDVAFLVCPTNNASTYFATLNDGLPYLFRDDGDSFRLTQFDASFVAAAGDVVLNPSLLLRVYGFRADGSSVFEDKYLSGPDVSGSYGFSTITMSSAFSSQAFAEIDFYGYACTTPTTCTRALDKAQFALDNINVVPEPTSWALVALGLIGSGALTRRSRKAA